MSDERAHPEAMPTVFGIRGHLVATPERVELARRFAESLPPLTIESVRAQFPELFADEE